MPDQEIRGFRRFTTLIEEGWQPPIPTSKRLTSKTKALAHMMQMNASMMMQVSTAIGRGQIKGARTKLRMLYRRLDMALRELERLERDS